MTEEQIEKLIKVGERKKFHAIQLARYVTEPPYSLSCVEATIVMEAYKKKHPETGPFFEPSPAMKLEANPVVAAKRTVRAWKKLCKPGKFPVNAGDTTRPLSDSADAMALAVHAAAGYTPSNLNRSSVKSFALATSTRIRAGKFKRVSPSFVKQVEAELENVIRGIGGPEDSDDTPGEWDFLNRKQISARVFEQLNRFIRKEILRKVRGHPSLGQTLR